MVYLEKVVLPDEEDEYAIARRRMTENGGGCGYLNCAYPCGIFPPRGLRELDFEPVTVLCGGNGSGKSTLLNVIAERLHLRRMAPFNGAELFLPYAAACKIRLGTDEEGTVPGIPENSRILTSDDVFDYMLAVRSVDEEIEENTEDGKADYARLKFGENIRLTGLEDYETFRLQVLARRKSLTRRKFLRKFAGNRVRLNSNGETAFRFFEQELKNDTLFCLDEPENSLSPAMQLRLRDLLSEKSRYCGCQFILSTHSPFLLSLPGAKIYDLDANPVTLRKWWELENTRLYFRFFEENRSRFRGERGDAEDGRND